jgi:hypothetical protein
LSVISATRSRPIHNGDACHLREAGRPRQLLAVPQHPIIRSLSSFRNHRFEACRVNHATTRLSNANDIAAGSQAIAPLRGGSFDRRDFTIAGFSPLPHDWRDRAGAVASRCPRSHSEIKRFITG